MAMMEWMMTWSEKVETWVEGGGGLGSDFPDASFPDWPSIRSRRLVGGFLLKPISACEEVP